MFRNHVKLDLHPYVCIVEECTAPVELFANSKEWLSHMRKRHFTRWTCGINTHETPVHFQFEDDFIEHLKAAHPKKFREEALPLIARHSSHTQKQIFEACPFCDTFGSELETHVAEHLRELALLSWPPADFEEDGATSCDPCENDENSGEIALRSVKNDTSDSELSFDDASNNRDQNWGVPGAALLEYGFLGQYWGLADSDGQVSPRVDMENDFRHPTFADAIRALSDEQQQILRKLMPTNAISIDAAFDEVYTRARELQQRCKIKRWSWNYRGRQVYLFEQVDKVVQLLDKFKAVGEIIANVNPVHVRLPWAGIRAILEVCIQR